MFAIIKTGGKQYRVKKGTRLHIEKLNTHSAGSLVDFNEVLFVLDDKGVHVGSPFVKGAVVSAQVIDHVRDDKVIIFKKKRRHNYRRKKGHRQHLTVIQIQNIHV